MPEKPKRFPPNISARSLVEGRLKYVEDCPGGGKHDWGSANAFTEVDKGNMSGHVSILVCSKCHQEARVPLTV